ncbi:ABC transporter substrate-binding protein [Ramlibacter albus]|uniref:ABC transporter substrate-binding protein n=1 Tax=Ramlibacter albus TaxID=2079448 RepID=A0A923M7K1_9BURK|nr:ABC transporter substrate-binding protein [Ramlibacter albus]MBC5765717.1 ABC transporter substrate-binding protein [Ramlibacter albus]
MPRVVRFLVVLATVALLGGTGALAQTRVPMVSLIVNSSYAPLWVAKDHGLFAKHGIDADLNILEGAWRRLGPEVPVGVVGIPAAMLGVAEGKDLKVLLPVDNTRVNSQLIAAPAIKTPDALRGKRIGTATFGAGAWINANLALRHFGLDPSRDGITFVDVGGAQQQAEALEAGRVDAIVMEPGRAAAFRAKGFTLLLDLEAANVMGVQSALVVTTQFLRERPDVVERIVTALVEGFAFALAPQNEQVVRETIARRMNLSTPAAVDTAYRSLLARSNRELYPSLEAMRITQRVIGMTDPRVLSVKVDELADDSIVRKLTASGTVERLYRSYGVK